MAFRYHREAILGVVRPYRLPFFFFRFFRLALLLARFGGAAPWGAT